MLGRQILLTNINNNVENVWECRRSHSFWAVQRWHLQLAILKALRPAMSTMLSKRREYLELGVFLSQMVLHMQQVLGCELAEAEDAQKGEVCQVARVLTIQVTKSYNADYSLEHVQVCVLNLQAIRTNCYAITVCHSLRCET